LRALADGGRSDVIFALNNRSDKPGYGYQLAHGATSLTEAWNARRASSQNHFMLGQITEWFYHDLAGIQCDPAGPGFKQIVINPAPAGDVTWVKASYNSIHGEIRSEWKRDGRRFVQKVTIPANTAATVFLPGTAPDKVLCNGSPAARCPNVVFQGLRKDRLLYVIGSGTYEFTNPL
jgi:alpha-L-rhamnosidase